MIHILLLKTRHPKPDRALQGMVPVVWAQLMPSLEDHTSLYAWVRVLLLPPITHILLLKSTAPKLSLAEKAAEAVASVQLEPSEEDHTSLTSSNWLSVKL